MRYYMGTAFIIIPLAVFLYRRYIIANGIEVDATVIRVEKTRGRNRLQPYYRAVYSYTVDGNDYETESLYGVPMPTQANGDIVHIHCHRNNPKIIVEQSLANVMVGSLLVVFAVAGLVMIISGMIQ